MRGDAISPRGSKLVQFWFVFPTHRPKAPNSDELAPFAGDVDNNGKAILVLLEEHGIAADMLHGFSWGRWTTGKAMERLALIPAGQEHILQQADGWHSRRRARIVADFQREDGPPFMVLSLKVGGTGLNLTAASHVIHFDR